MIMKKAGKVTDRITLLGREESTVYHVDGGNDAVLVGGGMIHTIPDIMEQIEKFGIDEKKISRVLVLHSHFDHCGIVGFLKKRWPWITIAASQPAKEMLVKPKVIENIKFMNQVAVEKFNVGRKLEMLRVDDFQGITVETVLSDGQKLMCGDLTLEIIAVPGHSPCSIAVYLPEEKAMFTSDAAGIAAGNAIFTAANSDFDKYQQSLEKMAKRDVAVVLAEHYGARTGDEGKMFLKQSIEAAKDYRRQIEASLKKTGDPAASTAEITEMAMKMGPSEFLPEEIVTLIASQMVNFIDKKQKSESSNQ